MESINPLILSSFLLSIILVVLIFILLSKKESSLNKKVIKDMRKIKEQIYGSEKSS